MQDWKEIHQNISSLSIENGAVIGTSYFILYTFVLLKINKIACDIT